MDLLTEKVLWQIAPDSGCDRMSMAADGKEIYLPSFEKDFWNLVDAANGDIIPPHSPAPPDARPVSGAAR